MKLLFSDIYAQLQHTKQKAILKPSLTPYLDDQIIFVDNKKKKNRQSISSSRGKVIGSASEPQVQVVTDECIALNTTRRGEKMKSGLFCILQAHEAEQGH